MNLILFTALDFKTMRKNSELGPVRWKVMMLCFSQRGYLRVGSVLRALSMAAGSIRTRRSSSLFDCPSAMP